MERNTRIRSSQIIDVLPSDIDAINSEQDLYYIRKASGQDKWEWVSGAGGAISLSELTDVDFDTGTPEDNQVLTYDTASGKWKAEDAIAGAEQLSDLSDVGVTTPTNRNVLVADGDSWESRALVEADISDLTHYTSADFDTDFTGKDTDDLSEGSSNKYLTGQEFQKDIDTLDDITDGSIYKKLKVDNFTIKENSNIIKIADRIELNSMLNAFDIAVEASFTKHEMVDGIRDVFTDESGVDTGTGGSTGQTYDSSGDYYKPTPGITLELDYMEYSTDELAQAGWPSSNPGVDWGYSGAFNGTNAYLTIPDSVDFDVNGSNSNTVTIDFWVRQTSYSGGTRKYYFEQWQDSNDFWYFIHKDASGFRFYQIDGGVVICDTGYVNNISDTDWHHIAFVRIATACGLYVDGNQVAYCVQTGIDTLAGDLNIGYGPSMSAYMVGNMDEIRIYYGNPLSATIETDSSGSLSLPTGPYTSDANTKLLLHLDNNVTDSGNTVHTITNVGSNMTYALHVVAGTLQDYSEATIKTQGSYSLKAIADITDSLNETLTNTLSKDLTGKDDIKFDIYSSRTGTNLQLQIHDSGGTTSTYNIVISSANEWETKTWDISGISDANKDDIDWIKIKIINADAENTFYIDNMYAQSSTENMILISESFTAVAEADTSRLILFEEDVDAITVNTDIKAYVSKDGGVTWEQVTLSDVGDYDNNKRILTGIVDLTVTGVGSGTDMKWKVTTHNEKSLKLHGIAETWG